MKKNKIFLFFFILMFVFLNISFVEAFVCCANQELAVGCENGCSQTYCVNCGEHEEGYCTHSTSSQITVYNVGDEQGTEDEVNNISNPPVLASGMTPVKWVDGSGWVTTTENDPEWYNYENNKWANVMLKDGSMFVWVPRYTYKIENEAIDIKWSLGIEDDTQHGYLRHPAFYMGEYYGGKLIENSSFSGRTGTLNELTGFWMAKYMASYEAGKLSFKSTDIDSLATDNILEAFNKTLELKENDFYGINETGVFTHLTKNSEWGAVAYLTMAKGNMPSTVNRSNTGNETGIYDLVSSLAEYTAGFKPVGNLQSSELNKSYNQAYVDRFTKGVTAYEGLSLDKDLVQLGLGTGVFVDDTNPVLIRGRDNIGLLGYESTSSTDTTVGFRAVIAVDDRYMKGEIALFETEASVVEGDSLIITVDLSVNKDWKFDLSDASLDDKVEIMNAIKLKFVQDGVSDNGDILSKSTDELNQELLQMMVVEDNGAVITNLTNEFDAGKKYLLKIKVGGETAEGKVFTDLTDSTSKIIVEGMKVLDTNGTPLNIEGYPYDKIRLTIFDIDGKGLELEAVELGSLPEKTDYYLGEEIDTSGGRLRLKYKGMDGWVTTDLKKIHVDNYQTLTNTSGSKTVSMTYNGKPVTGNFQITVHGKYKVNVVEKLLDGSFISLGIAHANKEAAAINESVSVTTEQSKNGYKFAHWSITDLANSTSLTTTFTQPAKNVTATANYRGVSYFTEEHPPKKEFENGDPFTLGPIHLIAHYDDGTSEDVTAETEGLKTSIPIDASVISSTNVELEYGGAIYSYDIIVGYKIILEVNDLYAGSIKDVANNIVKVPVNGTHSFEQCIPGGTLLNYLAQPNENYEFVDWTVSIDSVISNLADPSAIFNMPARELKLTANFASTQYKIEYLATDGGKVEGETSQIVKRGENTEYVTAVPNDGYYFNGWDDGVEDEERREVNVQENKTYTANFYRGHKVSFYANDILIGEPQIVFDGEDAVPPDDSEIPVVEGYTFTGEWSDSYLDVKEDLIIEAIYENNFYNVTVDSPAGVATIIGAGSYAYESDVTLNVENIVSGNRFSKWTLYKQQNGTWVDVTRELYSGEVASLILEFTMPAYNVKAVASFDSKVLIGFNVNGIDIHSYFKVGNEEIIKAGSDERYIFNEWVDAPEFMSSATSQLSTATINIPSVETDINAEFNWNTPLYYTIKTIAGPGGTISPTQTVAMGSKAEIKITPNSGYRLNKLIWDGEILEIDGYDITSIPYEYVNRDTVIEAYFEPI